MILTRQQRFIRNAKDSPYRKNSDDMRRGTYPTHYQMNQFEKYGVSYDVDPALRDVVIELNMRGYRTAGSCQGHDMRNHAFVSINSSKKEIPPEQATLSKREIYSMKNINVNEIKNIFKRHGIIITKYTPPSYNKRRIRDYHTFQFPAILDKAPPPDIIYWYKSSNGTLVYTDNKRNIPKQTRYLQMILTLETNLEHYKITDNGKIIWDKRVTAFNITSCDRANVSIEIQRVVHKALGIPYNDKKIIKQFTDSDELKKCKIGKMKP